MRGEQHLVAPLVHCKDLVSQELLSGEVAVSNVRVIHHPANYLKDVLVGHGWIVHFNLY